MLTNAWLRQRVSSHPPAYAHTSCETASPFVRSPQMHYGDRLAGGGNEINSRSSLCSAIDAIERLVEHGLVPGAVPRLDIGLNLPEKVGMRPLLRGEALGTERAHREWPCHVGSTMEGRGAPRQ